MKKYVILLLSTGLAAQQLPEPKSFKQKAAEKLQALVALVYNPQKPLYTDQDFVAKETQEIVKRLTTIIPEINELLKPNEGSAEAGAAPDREFKRTVAALRCLNWLLTENYEQFTKGQGAAVKLTKESFNWLSKLAKRVVCPINSRDAQYYALAINDLGKVYDVRDKVNAAAGTSTCNHDTILAQIFSLSAEDRARLLPTFSKLSPESQKLVTQLLTGSLNIAQLGQLEAVAIETREFDKLPFATKEFLFVHIMADVMGAAGFVNLDWSVSFTQPAAKTYMNLYEAMKTPDSYEAFMKKQAVRFGFIKTEKEDLTHEQIALTRLATMLRSNTPQDAAQVFDVFLTLDDKTRYILTNELFFGSQKNVGNPAIKIEYAPALLMHAKNTQQPKQGFEILAKLFSATRKTFAQSTECVIDVGARDLAAQIDPKGEKPITATELLKRTFVVSKINSAEGKASA